MSGFTMKKNKIKSGFTYFLLDFGRISMVKGAMEARDHTGQAFPAHTSRKRWMLSRMMPTSCSVMSRNLKCTVSTSLL